MTHAEKHNMLPQVNLLPPWMQARQRRAALLRRLALLQVVIFLMLGGLAVAARATHTRVQARAAQWAQALFETDRTPFYTAGAVTDMHHINLRARDFFDARFPEGFDAVWLRAADVGAPANVWPAAFDWSGAGVSLTAVAACVTYISGHRVWLHGKEIFDAVVLGTVAQLEDGYVRYVLRGIPLGPEAP